VAPQDLFQADDHRILVGVPGELGGIVVTDLGDCGDDFAEGDGQDIDQLIGALRRQPDSLRPATERTDRSVPLSREVFGGLGGVSWVPENGLRVAPELLHHLPRDPETFAQATHYRQEVVPGLIVVSVQVEQHIGVDHYQPAGEEGPVVLPVGRVARLGVVLEASIASKRLYTGSGALVGTYASSLRRLTAP
jgi:hypothetical protein